MKTEAHLCQCVSMLQTMYVFKRFKWWCDVCRACVLVVSTLIRLTQNSVNGTGGGFRQLGASACVCVYLYLWESVSESLKNRFNVTSCPPWCCCCAKMRLEHHKTDTHVIETQANKCWFKSEDQGRCDGFLECLMYRTELDDCPFSIYQVHFVPGSLISYWKLPAASAVFPLQPLAAGRGAQHASVKLLVHNCHLWCIGSSSWHVPHWGPTGRDE